MQITDELIVSYGLDKLMDKLPKKCTYCNANADGDPGFYSYPPFGESDKDLFVLEQRYDCGTECHIDQDGETDQEESRTCLRRQNRILADAILDYEECMEVLKSGLPEGMCRSSVLGVFAIRPELRTKALRLIDEERRYWQEIKVR